MISCQLAMYPLGVDDLGTAIDRALATLRLPGLDIESGPMSTTMVGGAAAVFAAVQRAF